MHSSVAVESLVRPFLKWAGGKRQLLPELRRFVPADFGSYHAPFLGSGAMFFALWRLGALEGRSCRLADSNLDPVGCHQAIARDVDDVIRELRRLEAGHAQGSAAAHYRVRDDLFNPGRRAHSSLSSLSIEAAASGGRRLHRPPSVRSRSSRR